MVSVSQTFVNYSIIKWWFRNTLFQTCASSFPPLPSLTRRRQRARERHGGAERMREGEGRRCRDPSRRSTRAALSCAWLHRAASSRCPRHGRRAHTAVVSRRRRQRHASSLRMTVAAAAVAAICVPGPAALGESSCSHPPSIASLLSWPELVQTRTSVGRFVITHHGEGSGDRKKLHFTRRREGEGHLSMCSSRSPFIHCQNALIIRLYSRHLIVHLQGFIVSSVWLIGCLITLVRWSS